MLTSSKETSTSHIFGGKELLYRLRVLQEPERTRACGFGQKALPDRRPIDPPPVVELRIFEPRTLCDVTFECPSTSFMFAILYEHPNVGIRAEEKSRTDLLVGASAVCVVHLERPDRAAYFTFSDLSIRRAGSYWLRFSLYERHDGNNSYLGGFGADYTYISSIDSATFIVYAARTFPGFEQSTWLTQTMAAQDYRIKVRRHPRRSERNGILALKVPDRSAAPVHGAMILDDEEPHHSIPQMSNYSTSLRNFVADPLPYTYYNTTLNTAIDQDAQASAQQYDVSPGVNIPTTSNITWLSPFNGQHAPSGAHFDGFSLPTWYYLGPENQSMYTLGHCEAQISLAMGE